MSIASIVPLLPVSGLAQASSLVLGDLASATTDLITSASLPSTPSGFEGLATDPVTSEVSSTNDAVFEVIVHDDIATANPQMTTVLTIDVSNKPLCLFRSLFDV